MSPVIRTRFPIAPGIWPKLVGASGIIFLGTLAGRGMGFLRELVLAKQVGVGSDADIAVLAFTFPDLLMGLLVAGSASTVLIPEFERLRRRDARWPMMLALRAGVAVFAVSLLVATAAVLLSGAMVRMLGPGLTDDVSDRAIGLLQIAAFAFPGFAVAAVVTAYLQHMGHFVVPAFATFFYNSLVVLAIWLWVRPGYVEPLAIAMAVAACLVLLTQVIAAWRIPRPASTIPFDASPRLVRRYLQALATGSAIILLPYLARAFASQTGEGGVATFNFALKMTELPNGTVLAAIAIPLLPAIARLSEAGESVEMIRVARRGALVLLITGVAVASIVALPAEFWSQVLYGRGSVTSRDTDAIGSTARMIALGLPAQALNLYLVNLYAVRGDFRRPLVLTLGALGVFSLLAIMLVGEWGVRGVAIALSGFHWLMLWALLLQLSRVHGVRLLART